MRPTVEPDRGNPRVGIGEPMPHHPHKLSHRANRRAALQGVLGLAAGLTFAGRLTPGTLAQDPTSVSLALDWYPNANHAGLYLAQDRGYFEDANLEVDILSLIHISEP